MRKTKEPAAHDTMTRGRKPVLSSAFLPSPLAPPFAPFPSLLLFVSTPLPFNPSPSLPLSLHFPLTLSLLFPSPHLLLFLPPLSHSALRTPAPPLAHLGPIPPLRSPGYYDHNDSSWHDLTDYFFLSEAYHVLLLPTTTYHDSLRPTATHCKLLRLTMAHRDSGRTIISY